MLQFTNTMMQNQTEGAGMGSGGGGDEEARIKATIRRRRGANKDKGETSSILQWIEGTYTNFQVEESKRATEQTFKKQLDSKARLSKRSMSLPGDTADLMLARLQFASSLGGGGGKTESTSSLSSASSVDDSRMLSRSASCGDDVVAGLPPLGTPASPAAPPPKLRERQSFIVTSPGAHSVPFKEMSAEIAEEASECGTSTNAAAKSTTVTRLSSDEGGVGMMDSMTAIAANAIAAAEGQEAESVHADFEALVEHSNLPFSDDEEQQASR